MKYAIETHRLSKTFYHQRGLLDFFRPSKKVEETIAVDKVNLTMEKGEVLGLLGPNGAGKTTLIKMLCTAIIPSSGTAKIYGYDVVKEDYRVKRLISLVSSDERSFFWRLTGKENMRFFASLHKLLNKEAEKRIDHVLDLFDLKDVADIRFNEYSTGMKQKLSIARGLLSKPKIMFLDEPTKGLDPVSALTLQNLIKERVVSHFGNSVLFTTHILSEAEKLADRIVILNRGQMIVSGSTEEIKSNYQESEKYHIEVNNLSEKEVGKIADIENVVSFSWLHSSNGRIHMEIRLLKDKGDISDILKFILQNNGRILRCTLIEKAFEDLFYSLVQHP